jgi:hypothetical protein
MAKANAMKEHQIYQTFSAEQLNLLTSLMPTLEGLFLATVLDGKVGLTRLSFDASQKEDVFLACRWIAAFSSQLEDFL